MKFTGFYEANEMVVTTVSYVELDELLARLRTRLVDEPPGTLVRIELLAWDDDSEAPD